MVPFGDIKVIAFQSTLSVRRATVTPPASLQCMEFQSTLSVRRATPGGNMYNLLTYISIHALRKESDVPPIGISPRSRNFNPRSP